MSWLVKAATPRFSTVYNCLLLVLNTEPAFRNLLAAQPEQFDSTEPLLAIKAILMNRRFWADLEILTPIAQSFNELSIISCNLAVCSFDHQAIPCCFRAHVLVVQACQAMQGRSSSLADSFRYFIYLAHSLIDTKSRQQVSPSFIRHAFQAFNRRFDQMATPLTRLALYLHPAYRGKQGGEYEMLKQLIWPPMAMHLSPDRLSGSPISPQTPL